VVLRLRFDDYATRATRSITLPGPTTQTVEILAAARGLLAAALPLIEERGITLIGVTLSNLDSAGRSQAELSPEPPAVSAADQAMDRVKDKFGSRAITRGVLLNRRDDPGVPLLPD
jgi:DNA polymerase IV